MASLKAGALPSIRRQQLLSEFAGLKQACPEGMFISLTPGDPTLWSGVLFVRNGPYSPAVLRFQISFPDSYPQLPPLVTFSTELFHPLLTPLTTYMYTTDIQDSGTVSASDQERLPPGGFSLRHGFPEWFGRGRRRNRQSTGQHSTSSGPGQDTGSSLSTPASKASSEGQVPSYAQTSKKGVSTYDILQYIRSNFNDEEALDSIPLSAAGNPGAWYAWRTYRRGAGKFSEDPAQTEGPPKPDGLSPESEPDAAKKDQNPGVRPPSEWDWDGVWEDRVKKGIATSLSEAVLFGGGTTSDDLLRFLAMEDNDVASVQENIRRSLGNQA
ncbi:ubiquitin-conjugating enzyme/RWD-like protein [Thelonectria olida]|uniref:Ubiquitin-conjugating enzyme/RWD-like protein n=1 Tax=Thelonectria olida TaxID=1576542 RepID=A0A9P8WC80_9HYPO|nr:ubiquitin-conjugating enzyme/RWD-like protein [Thelonectria olida]